MISRWLIRVDNLSESDIRSSVFNHKKIYLFTSESFVNFGLLYPQRTRLP